MPSHPSSRQPSLTQSAAQGSGATSGHGRRYPLTPPLVKRNCENTHCFHQISRLEFHGEDIACAFQVFCSHDCWTRAGQPLDTIVHTPAARCARRINAALSGIGQHSGGFGAVALWFFRDRQRIRTLNFRP